MSSGRAEDACNFRDIDAMLEAVRDKLTWFACNHDNTLFRVTSATMPICNDEGIQILINGLEETHATDNA